jgi:hypothetical protein
MQTIGLSVWALLAAYCLVCVWLPDIRFIYWKGTNVKLGAISYSGGALIFWSPLMAGLGMIPEAYTFVVYPLMLAGVVVTFIAYFIETQKR